jgi:hypothetical protein
MLYFRAVAIAAAAAVAEAALITPTRGELAIPTPAQLQWANHGYGAFVHFNMGTYVSDGGGCNVRDLRKDKRQAKLDPDLFAPTAHVDTDQWVSLIKAYGGKYAVLTVKHNCGFLLYPSNTSLPDGSRFNYSVAQSSYAGGGADVVADFVASCKKYGIRPGFYFSLASSAIFDVSGNTVLNSSLVPGQVRVTQAQYVVFELFCCVESRVGSEVVVEHAYYVYRSTTLWTCPVHCREAALSMSYMGMCPLGRQRLPGSTSC